MTKEFIEAYNEKIVIDADIRKNNNVFSCIIPFVGIMGSMYILPEESWLIGIVPSAICFLGLFIWNKNIAEEKLYLATGVLMLVCSMMCIIVGVMIYKKSGGLMILSVLMLVGYIAFLPVTYTRLKEKVASGYYVNAKRKDRGKSALYSSAALLGVAVSKAITRNLSEDTGMTILGILLVVMAYLFTYGVYYVYKYYLTAIYRRNQ